MSATVSATIDYIDYTTLEPLAGISAWFRDVRPRALLLRPYGFIVFEDADIHACSSELHLLVKKCVDTLNALKRLRFRANIAGLKDANAVTAQHVSAATRLQTATRDVVIVPLDEKGCIRRGAVRRNNFTITILIIDSVEPNTGELLTPHSRAPNYYGFQRFGARRPNTHMQGLYLAAGMPGRLLREYRVVYPHESRGLLSGYEKLALQYLRGKRSILAARRIPHHIVELMGNALQAYLFNRVLSSLVEALGEAVCWRYERLLVPGCGVLKAISDAELRRQYRLVLDEEGVDDMLLCNLKSYGVRVNPYPRETCIETQPRIYEDRLANKTRVIVSFDLPRGAFATVFLANSYQLLEPNPDLLAC